MNSPSSNVVACITFVACLTLSPHPAASDVPTPECSIVPPLLTISPDGSIPYTIKHYFSGCEDPVVGAVVTLQFSPEVDALIAWAPGQDHQLVTTTDANGEATFNVAGAGCIDLSRFTPSTYIALVKADGVTIAKPMVNSPDAVNSQGLLPTELGTNICENGESEVGLSDAVFFTGPIKLGLVEPCAKFVGPADEPVHLGDAVFLTEFLTKSTSLVCQ